MKRILITGRPGAGKSTLAKKLAKLLNIPYFHLDLVHHDIEYKKQYQRAVAASENQYIIEGAYIGRHFEELVNFDTIIILDIDKLICLQNIYKRKSIKRDDFPNNFHESEITWDAFIERTQLYDCNKLLEYLKTSNTNATIYILKDYIEIDNFLKTIKY